MDNEQKMRNLGAVSLKWDVFVKSLPLGLNETYRRMGRKIVRDRGDGGQQRNSPSKHSMTEARKNEYTEILAAGTMSAQVSSGWHPSSE